MGQGLRILSWLRYRRILLLTDEIPQIEAPQGAHFQYVFQKGNLWGTAPCPGPSAIHIRFPHFSVALIYFCRWIDCLTYSRNKTQLVSYSTCHAVCLPLTQSRTGKSSNLYHGFQAFGADVITNFLFATSFDQLSFPDFAGDIVRGVDMCLPAITLGRFSILFVWIVRYFPPSILMLLAPSLKGLVVFKRVSSNGCHHVVQETDPP